MPDTTRAAKPAAASSSSSSSSSSESERRRSPAGRAFIRFIARVLLVVALALAVGGLIPFARAALTDALDPFTNALGGWLIVTVVLVLIIARGTFEAAIEGALALVAATMGYAAVSTARGDYFDPSIWAFVGVFAGPVIGLAALGLRRRGVTAAIGAAILGGILVGEGAYGLTVGASTASPLWWLIEIAVGLAIVVVVSIRMKRPGLIALAVLGMAVLALALWGAFSLLPVLLVL